jgi:co-chaperonin GroES (HSP10)
MVVALTPYLAAVADSDDPKSEILKWVGDLSEEKLLGDRVMVGTYARPIKSGGGVWLPDSQRQEDRFQGVVGLLLTMGPNAFMYDGSYRLIERELDESDQDYRIRWADSVPKVGDWVVYRPADGFEMAFRRASCRVFRSESVMGIASDPLLYY